MNGIELVKRIKHAKSTAAFAVLIVSYKEQEEHHVAGLEAGASYYLTKIGASTRGPKALATVLRALPAGLAAVVTIVQHVDAKFASDLVQWLSEQTELPVSLAREGMRP